MYPTFPFVQRGDFLSAEHVNRLSLEAAAYGRALPGSYLSGNYGPVAGSYMGAPPSPPAELVVSGALDTSLNLYPVRVRRYDYTSSSWVTDESSGPFWLDAVAGGETYAQDDTLRGYWHDQRQAFIPLGAGGTGISIATLTETLEPGSNAEATIGGETVRIVDPYYKNFGLLNEVLFVIPNAAAYTDEDDLLQYVPIGSWGLRRFAVATTSIGAGGSGSVNVQRYSATASFPDDSDVILPVMFMWMASGSAITPTTQLLITYFDRVGWFIDGVGCGT